METISVVVPVYNVAAELGRCVASIVAQSYGNLQIVLVDDGSTDGSGALCDAHARDDARIAVVHKPNGGLSSARNAGLAAATGTWVLYVDADDWIEPDACARLQAAGAAARADVVVGEALWETPAGVRRMAHRALEDGAAISGRDYIVYAVRNRELYVPVWLNLYRRDFLVRNDLRCVEGLVQEDLELLPRVFTRAERVAYAPGAFYHYVDRATSIMNATGRARRARSLAVVYARWAELCDGLQDRELQRALRGHMVRSYLHACRELGLRRGLPDGALGPGFLVRNALTARDACQALGYVLFPDLYRLLGRLCQR